MNKLVRAELVLSVSHVRAKIREAVDSKLWAESLPSLLSDFTGLLRDALDLWRELGYADDTTDQSFLSQPSISEHPNRPRTAQFPRFGALDESEPRNESPPAIGQQIAHVLTPRPLREQDVAHVETSVEHQVDHGKYCIWIQFGMLPNHGTRAGIQAGVR